MTEGILIQRHDGVMELRMDRPEKLNAVTPAMTQAIGAAVAEATNDPGVRCLLVTGTGRGFCAGRDLSSAAPDEDAQEILATQMNPVIAALYECPKPTIAAVNGAAMGFGLGLALACDVVYAGHSARFAVPFARLGAALDSGGHYLLRSRLPAGRVLEMIYTAEAVDGQAAAAIGLADRCCPDAELQARAMALARACADGPAQAFQRQKALLRQAATSGLRDVLDAEAQLQGELALTGDYREGVAAFQAKRKPVFSGR